MASGECLEYNVNISHLPTFYDQVKKSTKNTNPPFTHNIQKINKC